MKVLLTSLTAALAAATAAFGQADLEAPPVVVELFTSQGCSACPKANRMLGELSLRGDIIGLAFAVDYWDYLGWDDTFAQPQFVARQRAYAPRLRNRGVYTPQMVVNGRENVPGLDQSKVEAAVSRNRGMPNRGPAVSIAIEPVPTSVVRVGAGDRSVELEARPAGRVLVKIAAGEAPPEEADVWLIAYLDGRRDVVVSEGENKGETVSHFNIVTQLERLGGWSGDAAAFEGRIINGESVAVLVQEKELGPILSAANGALLGSTSAAPPTTFDQPDSSGR